MPRVWARMLTQDGYKNSVGDRVRERRYALGLTQMALGGRISVHSQGRWAPTEDEIYGLERRLRLVTDLEVKVLSSSLECSILYLMGEEDGLLATDLATAPAEPISASPRRRNRKVTPSK